MAHIDSRVVFVTTSPRTPAKMVPEIALLDQHFALQPWNAATQAAFTQCLREADFFHGQGQQDPAFSARDRINRAPQSLGFVTLDPVVRLTAAGRALVSARRTGEVLLRQMLKFQVPSPYHTPSARAATFCVKPYLEVFRLIRHLGSLRFDELQLFALQLTDYHLFDQVVEQIRCFRKVRAAHEGSYRAFFAAYAEDELRRIYAHALHTGQTQTRESRDASAEKFLRTKRSNMRDYADALVRYLRATGMVSVSQGRTLSIIPEREADVDYFLRHTPREPQPYADRAAFLAYLGDASLPALLTDDRERLIQKFRTDFPQSSPNDTLSTAQLRDLYADELERRKTATIDAQVRQLKSRTQYADICATYRRIMAGECYDAPLMLEWNTWRAMTMLDGGDIRANLHFDDFGQPASTAQGNVADIVCDYGAFCLSVEVTLTSGQRQYETEGEPVARHLGRLKQQTAKPAYCLFVAPQINEACIAHFYTLQRVNIAYYGGRSCIVPLPLDVFIKMVEASHTCASSPQPRLVARLFDYAAARAATSRDEREWYEDVKARAVGWLEER